MEPAIQKGDTRFHRIEQVYHGTTQARHTHAAPRKWIEGALLRCRLPSLVVLTQLSCCARLGFCCLLYYTASLYKGYTIFSVHLLTVLLLTHLRGIA